MFQRKDGIWVEKIPIPGKQPKVFTGKTQRIVKQKIAEWRTEGEKGKSFADAAEAWDAWHMEQVSHNAHELYRPMLARAKEFFSGRYLKDITPDEVQAFVNKMANRGYAKSTVQKHLNMMRMIFDHAITQPDSGVHYNPCGSVRVPAGLAVTRREPPTDEQLKLVRPSEDSTMHLFAFFLLYTGLRRGELLGLRWEDIDRENKLIHVRRNVYYVGNNPHLKDPKTEAGKRSVVLLDILADELPQGGKGYVFGGDTPLTKSAFRKGWTRLCRDLGLVTVEERKHYAEGNKHEYIEHIYKPTVTPHQFRHAYASMLDDAGIDEMGAKTLMGHASIAVTKDIYTHIRERKKTRVGEALNDYVKQQNGT